jgi:hypothetical protein
MSSQQFESVLHKWSLPIEERERLYGKFGGNKSALKI